MSRLLVVAALLCLPTVVHADEVPVAIGVNTPIGWGLGAFATSVSVGLTDHQAIRGNVASWQNTSDAIGLIAAAAGGEDEASRGGRTTDVGIGWTYFPDRLWDGFSLELGALYRRRDTTISDDNSTPSMLATHTGTLAGRALVGWSWLMTRHVYISVSVGVSVGHESGTEIRSDDLGQMPMTTAVSRLDVQGEAFARIGFAFGL